MSDSNANRPVLIKRKIVKAAEGHHSGAWKVAYADFVTAMMAFFLLMWLLNATSEDQRQGLADYFNPTIKITRSSGGGDGVLNGESIMSDQNHVKTGSGGLTELEAGSAQDPDGFGATSEAVELQKIVEEELFARGGESRTMEQLLRHVITRVTDEGLVIELFDLDKVGLFEEDSATLTSESIVLAGLITNVINRTRNQVAVNGHVRGAQSDYESNRTWPISSARAQAFRSLLESHGLDEIRVQRVTGYADRIPAISNPSLKRNNRIEIILLRRDR